MANQPPFEIPAELRDMAERNVEQARAAYGHFMDFLSQSIGAWAGAQPADDMTGFRSLQERAVAFAKENADRSFNLASELTRAKDIQEVILLQSRFVQTQMQSFAMQAQQFGWLMADTIRDIKPKE